MKTRFVPLITCLLTLASTMALAADTGKNLGAVSYSEKAALRVVDEKCLVCHNRQRIEKAVDARKDMDKIVSAMEQKGAKLSPTDRKIMGHFWQQNPFKANGTENKQP